MNELLNPIHHAFDTCNQELKKCMEEKKSMKENQVNENGKEESIQPVDTLSMKKCNSLNTQQLMYQKKLKNYRKPPDQTTIRTLDDIDESVIPTEITLTMRKKSWKTLDNCFKWNLIEKYIESKKEEPDQKPSKSDLKNLKNMIINRKKDDVVYDKNENKITFLNYELENKCII